MVTSVPRELMGRSCPVLGPTEHAQLAQRVPVEHPLKLDVLPVLQITTTHPKKSTVA